MGWLRGNLYLAWRAAVVHPLRRLRERRPRGLVGFIDHYGSEGLLPTTSRDKAMLAAAGRCISCGLCDELDGHLRSVAHPGYQGASLFSRQYARSSVEIAFAREVLEAIDPERYREGEAVCPTRVPLVELARWLQERLARRLALLEPPRPIEGDGGGDRRDGART